MLSCAAVEGRSTAAAAAGQRALLAMRSDPTMGQPQTMRSPQASAAGPCVLGTRKMRGFHDVVSDQDVVGRQGSSSGGGDPR